MGARGSVSGRTEASRSTAQACSHAGRGLDPRPDRRVHQARVSACEAGRQRGRESAPGTLARTRAPGGGLLLAQCRRLLDAAKDEGAPMFFPGKPHRSVGPKLVMPTSVSGCPGRFISAGPPLSPPHGSWRPAPSPAQKWVSGTGPPPASAIFWLHPGCGRKGTAAFLQVAAAGGMGWTQGVRSAGRLLRRRRREPKKPEQHAPCTPSTHLMWGDHCPEGPILPHPATTSISPATAALFMRLATGAVGSGGSAAGVAATGPDRNLRQRGGRRGEQASQLQHSFAAASKPHAACLQDAGTPACASIARAPPIPPPLTVGPRRTRSFSSCRPGGAPPA